MAFFGEMFGRRPGAETTVTSAPEAPVTQTGQKAHAVEMTAGTAIILGPAFTAETPGGFDFSKEDKVRIQRDAQQRTAQRGATGGYGARIGRGR